MDLNGTTASRLDLRHVFTWLASRIQKMCTFLISSPQHDHSPLATVNEELTDEQQCVESKTSERRSGRDRRQAAGERRGNIGYRMQFGFAQELFRATEAGSIRNQADVVKVLLKEAQHYRFYDNRGAEVDAETVLKEAVEVVGKGGARDWVGLRAAYDLSAFIYGAYDYKLIQFVFGNNLVDHVDRRKVQRRAADRCHPLAR